MRWAAAPRTPRLKRKDTLHAYRVAANATDSPWGRSHKLGGGALGTPGAQDQENVIFSLTKVTSSGFFCVGTNCLLCSREHLARKAAEHSLPLCG